MKPWAQYLIAFLIFCHGFIYVRIGSMLPAPVKGRKGSSWLLDEYISNPQLTTLVVVLHVIAGIATLVCAVAIGVPSLLPGWWRPLAMTGACSVSSRSPCFGMGRQDCGSMRGGLGALISLIILTAAITFPAAFE